MILPIPAGCPAILPIWIRSVCKKQATALRRISAHVHLSRVRNPLEDGVSVSLVHHEPCAFQRFFTRTRGALILILYEMQYFDLTHFVCYYWAMCVPRQCGADYLPSIRHSSEQYLPLPDPHRNEYMMLKYLLIE